MVELIGHLHVTFGEALVVPAHVVIPWPHAVDLAVEEIIQTPGAICQLAKALRKSGGGKSGKIRNMTRPRAELNIHTLDQVSKIMISSTVHGTEG